VGRVTCCCSIPASPTDHQDEQEVDPARAHAMCSVSTADKRLLQWITDSQIAALIPTIRRRGRTRSRPTTPSIRRCRSTSLPVQARLNLGEIWC